MELLGVDLGAGGLKATIIDNDGLVVVTASTDIQTARPHAGWTEQDPADWEKAMRAALSRLSAMHGLDKVAAVSFTAGAHTAVLMGEDRAVLRPAILWSDQRSGKQAADLNARLGDRLTAIAHNRAAATWTLPQMAWLGENEPAVAARIRYLQLAKDWLRSRLTGDFLTDRIDAEGTLMAEAGHAAWSAELCGAIEWPLERMPEIKNPSEIAGAVSREAADRYGLREGIPVVVGTSDTAAETWAAGAISPGFGVIKLATAGTVSMMTATPHPESGLINYGHVVPGHNYLIAGTNSCASAHRWLRNILVGPEGSSGFAELDKEAAAIPAGSDGLLFHPYLEGERSPYWDPLLRADFLGLTSRHTRGHMVRALYEGIAFSLKDCSLGFNEAGLDFEEFSLIGGGVRSAIWPQIIADVMGVRIRVPEQGDASFGAALLAGVGIGAFKDERDAVRRCVRFERTIEPDSSRAKIYADQFARYRRTKQLLTDVYHEMSQG